MYLLLYLFSHHKILYMKRIAFLAVMALAALPMKAGRIITDSIPSNILGETVAYNVYLPDSFGTEDRAYPVVYLLHGLSDDYRAWDIKGGMQTVIDELIRSGEAREMVVIMPNAGGPDIHNTWNGYFNMPGRNYEDFFFGELVPEVEKKYNCGGSKGMRAMMGLSMGGGGSTVYCQRHPEMFSSCYAMSPWLDNQSGEVGGDNPQQDKFMLVSEAVKAHSAIAFVEQADEETLARLRTVAWFFDCGDDDFLLQQSMDMHMRMRAAGVHSELRVRDGAHNWEYWHLALRLSLPFVSRNFN